MPDEPGWYPDPKGEANYRFHDGRKWTKSVAEEPPNLVAEEDHVEGGLLGLLEHQPENQPFADASTPPTPPPAAAPAPAAPPPPAAAAPPPPAAAPPPPPSAPPPPPPPPQSR
jgi:Protein of unknown function (DUF2510)